MNAIADEITDGQRRALLAHFSAPDHTATGSWIARKGGISRHSTVNLHYWRLAEKFCKATGHQPDERDEGGSRWWSVWSTGYPSEKGFVWVMLPEVAEAIRALGWDTEGIFLLPGEGAVLSSEMGEKRVPYSEGSRVRVDVNRYERSSRARDACLKHHGATCVVCGFDFGRNYGQVADDFIHVHHLKPLSEIDGSHEVDPEKELVPVCPNCHAVIHLGGGNRSIEDVRHLIANSPARAKDE